MQIINGAYTSAIVYTDEIEASAIGQIQALCDQPFAAGSKIRIMPDVHTGKGCTIGTTMTVGEYVVPNLVGVDIGCGMDVVQLKEKRINLPALDSFISKNIPHGRDVREKPHRNSGRIDLSELECFGSIDTRRALESVGTLGGGNHFIEVDRDEEDNLYLVIHTGSRNLGLQVAEYYQKLAYENVGGRSQTEIPFELAYLTGEDRDRYLHDMAIMQRYAALNRQTIRDCILDGLKLICRSLLLSAWSPAVSYPLYPGAPAVVVVKYVVVPKRSRGTGKIAVPRERLYRNSDRQKSQVILSSQAAAFPTRQPPASPAVILSGAKNPFPFPGQMLRCSRQRLPVTLKEPQEQTLLQIQILLDALPVFFLKLSVFHPIGILQTVAVQGPHRSAMRLRKDKYALAGRQRKLHGILFSNDEGIVAANTHVAIKSHHDAADPAKKTKANARPGLDKSQSMYYNSCYITTIIYRRCLMPPKSKVTREMIVNAAAELARENGAEAINARTVAQKLNCSTQPVMYQFATIEALKRAAYEQVDQRHTDYLLRSPGRNNPLLEIGLNYIRFAIEEPHWFRFLFQSGYARQTNLPEMIDSEELRPVLSAMQQGTGLDAKKTRDVFLTVALFAHGYASMLANNALEYDEQLVAAHLERAFIGAMLAANMEEKHEKTV